MEKISWRDRMSNEKMNIITERKKRWIGHILRGNGLLRGDRRTYDWKATKRGGNLRWTTYAEELIMMNLRVRHRTEKFGEITCLKPANWQITNDDDFKKCIAICESRCRLIRTLVVLVWK